jgi:hypothetical protein
MSTDLDRDDELGTRLRALQAWTPPVSNDDGWTGVERRRRRKVGRAAALACGALFLVVFGAVVATSTDSKDAVRVVTPPPTSPPTLPQSSGTPVTMPGFPNDAATQPVVPVDARLHVTPPGPYSAGALVAITLATDLAGDYFNEGSPTVCYAWSDGELCDPEVRAHASEENGGVVRWELKLPGWVFTPTGRQPCEVVRCRVEAGGPGRLGTEVLTIAAGAQPDDHARVVETRTDGTVVVDVDGLQPDASWTAWAEGKSDEQIRDHGALGMGVCVFRAALYCDGLVTGTQIPPDGGAHRIEIQTNRRQFTFSGWRDCVVDVCVVVVWRTVGVVEEPGGGTGSYTEPVAVLPYRLPTDTPDMPVPRLTLDRAGPFAKGDTVRATVHDLPLNFDGDVVLAQCAADNLGVTQDCRSHADNSGRVEPGSHSTTVTITSCDDPRGCYIAITPHAKGYDAIAKTERFEVTG